MAFVFERDVPSVHKIIGAIHARLNIVYHLLTPIYVCNSSMSGFRVFSSFVQTATKLYIEMTFL